MAGAETRFGITFSVRGFWSKVTRALQSFLKIGRSESGENNTLSPVHFIVPGHGVPLHAVL